MIAVGIIREYLDGLQKLSRALNDDDYLEFRRILRNVRIQLEVIEKKAY